MTEPTTKRGKKVWRSVFLAFPCISSSHYTGFQRCRTESAITDQLQYRLYSCRS